MEKEPQKPQNETPTILSRLTKWAELIYSDEFPVSLSWDIRLTEAEKKLGYKLSEGERQKATNDYFENHAQARAYWSLFRLYQNVCQSVELEEEQGENASYKTKIENGLKLPTLWKLVEEQRDMVFKKNTQAEFDFASGKGKSSFKKSEADLSMERLKAKYKTK
jgi:hypothetical protein